MKEFMQSIPHKPAEGQQGDCFRAALASLLEIDPSDVPHFFEIDMDADDSWENVKEWLKSRGYSWFSAAFNCDLDDVMAFMQQINPGIYYLLAGNSGRGTHQVIACGDVLVHDPSPYNTGLIGPCDDGMYWINLVLPAAIHDRLGM